MADELLNAQSEPSDSEIEDLLIAAQTGGDSPEWRKLLGNSKLGTFLRVGIEAMLDTDKVDTRKALEIVAGTSVEWKNPTVTNLEEDMAVDMFVGNATETEGIVRFDAEFRLGYTDNDVSWGTASPRLTLPIESSNPSRVVGTGAGYGGSECKYFHSFSEDVVAEDNITFGGRTSATDRGSNIANNIYAGTTDDDGTVYIGGFNHIYTLNLDTLDATIYAENVALPNYLTHSPGTIGWEVNALAWHDDTLYATWGLDFYTVSPGVSQYRAYPISGLDFSSSEAFGLHSFDGTLYYVATKEFGTIDTTTNTANLITTLDLTNRGYTQGINTLFSYDGILYGVNRDVLYEFTDITTGAVRIIHELPLDFHGSFVSDGRVYFLNTPWNLHSIDLTSRLISSVDFRGETYTTAIGQIAKNGSLIQVNIDKMQCNTSPVLLSISGSYKK